MRENRIIICDSQHFIPTILEDKDFLNPYPEKIKDIYNITNATTPILFSLSTCIEPKFKY